MLFDDRRVSVFALDTDMIHEIATDLSGFAEYDPATWENKEITILSPRDWHPTKCCKPESSMCILDEQFFQSHPRSAKRIAFIQQYADHYGIKIYKGNINTIIQSCSNKGIQITVYETRNPYYREAYENAI